MARILSENCSIINLNLGSYAGSERNRLGKEGGIALAYGFGAKNCLIQFLHLRSVTMGNDELELFAEALQDYHHLTEIDLSFNRIEGARGGAAISSIINRGMNRHGACDLEELNLSNNKLGDLGFASIVNELFDPNTCI